MTYYGFIIPGKSIASETVEMIKYKKYNLPIRSMFASSMIKQAILKDDRTIRKLISSSKILLNKESK